MKIAMKFKLQSQFKPAGDQPGRVEGLIKLTEAGRKYQTLLGVTGQEEFWLCAQWKEHFKNPR